MNIARRVLIVACGALIVAATLSLVAVTVLIRRNHPSSGPPSSVAPTSAEVNALLGHHSAALLGRDRAQFAADLDSSDAAAVYRAQQLRSFDNLADVPLASWQLSIDAPVTSAEEIAPASARLGASATIVKIQLAYALTNVDPAPTHHSLWLTIVHRNGATVISGDSDLADAAGVSWKGPWDFGPVVAFRGASSLVLAHPRYSAQLTTLASVIDQAVTAVTAVWGTGWTQQVAVIVPDSQAEMTAVIGNNLVLEQIDAVSVADVDLATPNDGLANKLLGQRVVLNPANLSKLTDVGRQIVIRHEVTLVATRPISGSDMPTWLIEGFAEYVANLNSGQSTRFAAAELSRDVVAMKLPKALPSTADFNSENAGIAQIYEQSWLACQFIAERVDAAGLLTLFRSVAQATQAVPASTSQAAVESALQSVLGSTTAQFVTDWASYLRAQLG